MTSFSVHLQHHAVCAMYADCTAHTSTSIADQCWSQSTWAHRALLEFTRAFQMNASEFDIPSTERQQRGFICCRSKAIIDWSIFSTWMRPAETIFLLQRSADVAKLHEELQVQTDARVDETTKQRQQILTLDIELEAKQKEIHTIKNEAQAAKEQLQKDESAAQDLLRAELSIAADGLNSSKNELSEAQDKLQTATDNCDRVKADLHESNDNNQNLR